MGQPKGQFHNVFLVIILYDRPDFEKNVDCFILDCFIIIIQQLIKHSEDLVGRLILLDLRALFLHELDQGNKLVQESNLNFTDLRRKDMQRHDQAVDEEALLNLIRKVHQSLREIQFIVVIEILDIRLNGLLRGQHAVTGVALIRRLVRILGHLFEGLHTRLEPHLRFLDVLATELTCLQLGVNRVGLLVLQVEKFLVDQRRVQARPTRLEGIVL